MDDLPEIVNDTESLVRTIKTPYHFKKNGEVKWQAFKPQVNNSAISVIRQLMGDDFCKNKSLEIAKNAYIGLAVLLSIKVRQCGSKVYDDRREFLGHAHIDHEICLPQEDRADLSENSAALQQRCIKLLEDCIFHEDPKPKESGWFGTPLQRK